MLATIQAIEGSGIPSTGTGQANFAKNNNKRSKRTIHQSASFQLGSQRQVYRAKHFEMEVHVIFAMKRYDISDKEKVLTIKTAWGGKDCNYSHNNANITRIMPTVGALFKVCIKN